MRYLAALIVSGGLAVPAAAHGSQPPPPPEPPRSIPVDPRFATPPPPPPPPVTPTDEFDPTGPVTPTPGGAPTPRGPGTPTPGGATPGSPPVATPPRTRPAVRPGRRAGTGGTDWRLWWEYNREYLVGLRGMLRDVGPVTGPRTGVGRDPLGVRRVEVLTALRATARAGGDRMLRAAAVIALARAGSDRDARLILNVLHDKRTPNDVREAAAVALGVVPATEPVTHTAVRTYLEYVLRHPRTLPDRARGLAILATGLRARSDPRLRMRLLGRAAAGPADGEEAANVALACGLAGDPLVVPELIEAARRGNLGGRRLSDVERAHAVQGIGLTGDKSTLGSLEAVLRSRRVGPESRRSAALAIGRILRENGELGADTMAKTARGLAKVFDKSNDALLRGFIAIALGGAREPQGLLELRSAIDHGGAAAVKPYCALGLGLAARTLDGRGAKRIRSFLREELDKTNDIELGSALALALGLAGAAEAEEDLRSIVARKSRPAPVRGAAAQGLGLLRKATPETMDVLTAIVRAERSGPLLEDAALALGLLGRRGVAAELARILPRTSSSLAQGRLILALGYLDHSAAVAPLLEILNEKRNRTLVREFACVALGLLGDRRPVDALFDLDAYYNFYATTRASNELIRLY